APASLVVLAQSLVGTGQVPLAVTLLRDAQQRHPSDFWVHHTLAYLLSRTGSARDWPEAVGCYRIALALRPDSPGAYLNLGVALDHLSRWTEAETAYRQAIALRPDYAQAWSNLGK